MILARVRKKLVLHGYILENFSKISNKLGKFSENQKRVRKCPRNLENLKIYRIFKKITMKNYIFSNSDFRFTMSSALKCFNGRWIEPSAGWRVHVDYDDMQIRFKKHGGLIPHLWKCYPGESLGTPERRSVLKN